MITKQPNDYVKIANQQLIKQNNLTLVFNLINRYEPISRVKLARLTRLSPTTISSLVEELLENELVMEIGAGKTNSSGRKPIMLKVNQKSRFVISLEVKKDKISGGVYDLKCNEIARKSISEYDIAELGNGLISLCEELIEESKLNRNNFLGIALGIPGIINYRDYTVVSSTVIEKLHTNKTFYTELSNRFSNIPILMENESCFAAYAEHTIARSGREGDNILIDINEGVGCGIIIDDNIYKGAWGIAGELGHMTIDMNGEHCECGNRGCLETLVSIPAILKRALKAAEEKKSGVFWELVQKKDLPLFDSFLKAYEDKDPVALETVLHAADCLAFGINNAVNLLDIRQIGISGRITKFGKLFIDRVKQKVKSMSFDLYGDKIQVNYSVLGDDTVVLGGARYLLDNIYRPKRDFANQGI